MKYNKLILLFSSLILLGGNLKAQALDEGEMFFDVYYGLPNLGKNALRDVAQANGAPTETRYGGIGPLGARLGFITAENLSFGVMVNYSSATMSFHTEPDPPINTTAYDTKLSYNRLLIMPTFTVHNLIDDEKVDMFFSVGLGYRRAKFIIWTTEPGVDSELETTKANTDPDLSLYRVRIAARISFGARYYLNDNFGLLGEVGIGGPVLSFGATLRLRYSSSL